MTHENEDISASEYVCDSFEGISRNFTDIETIYAGRYNIVARAKRYGRWWALKGIVHPDEHKRQRLRKEFEILAEMGHPGIVAPVGLEDVDGIGVCIVMEYIEGMTLGEWLASKPPRVRRRNVARRIVDAMSYVHSKNIVHRDLKPSNIMVTRNGDMVKIIDFGLADTDSHATLKQSAGTRRYMSPEQAGSSEPDLRNDIYSLGLILDEMGLGYGRIVKRCLLPAEGRYRDAGELSEAMARRNRGGTRVAILAGVVGLVACIVVGGAELLRLRQLDEEHRAVNDSLKSALVSQKAAFDEQKMIIDSLNSVGKVSNDVDSRFNRAVNDGFAILRETFAKSEFKNHVDTLSDYKYYKGLIEITPVSTELVEAIKAYTSSLNGYNEMEKSQIDNMMFSYAQTLVDTLNYKLNGLKEKNDRTSEKRY